MQRGLNVGTLSYLIKRGVKEMSKLYYNQVRFRVVYRGSDKKIRWRFVSGYHAGNLYGGSVKLYVYRDIVDNKKVWYCIDPETGLSIGQGKTRMEAIDNARARLTSVERETYQKCVYNAKRKWVEEFGLMEYDHEEGYKWLQPKI